MIITIDSIQRAVAQRYRVPVSYMTEAGVRGGRQRKKAWPRQVAIVLSTRLTEHSLKRIGYFFGRRDHTTIIYACKAVEKRRLKNPRLHQSLRQITLELVRSGPAGLEA